MSPVDVPGVARGTRSLRLSSGRAARRSARQLPRRSGRAGSREAARSRGAPRAERVLARRSRQDDLHDLSRSAHELAREGRGLVGRQVHAVPTIVARAPTPRCIAMPPATAARNATCATARPRTCRWSASPIIGSRSDLRRSQRVRQQPPRSLVAWSTHLGEPVADAAASALAHADAGLTDEATRLAIAAKPSAPLYALLASAYLSRHHERRGRARVSRRAAPRSGRHRRAVRFTRA